MDESVCFVGLMVAVTMLQKAAVVQAATRLVTYSNTASRVIDTVDR